MSLIMFTCIAWFVLYLWGRDVEHFSDLGVQLLDVGESVNAACGTPMSQLGVEDELRSRVFWWPWWWRWRWRKRRRCRRHTPLILALVLGLLLLHGLSPCCFVLRAQSLPVLHRAPAQVRASSGSPGGALLWQSEKLCPSPRLADQPTNSHPELWGEERRWISDECSPVTVAGRGQPDPAG